MKQYIVDAFTTQLFGGNPAAVCLLDAWCDDAYLLKIAQENNLSETAFLVGCPQGYELRWFTPKAEIDLCGHATLAAAHVLFTTDQTVGNVITFQTASGILTVTHEEGQYAMAFPRYALEDYPIKREIVAALGQMPLAVYLGRDLVCVLESEQAVRDYVPDLAAIEALDGLLFHITAPSNLAGIDCVSRSFAPKLGVVEDPVCGSGHCHLFPLWSQRMDKERLVGYQASQRGGVLVGEVQSEQVVLSGNAVTFSVGELQVTF